MIKKRIDITGEKYNKLTVLNEGKNIKNVRYWVCKCDCGTIKEISMNHLRNGKTKSCGCYIKEKTSKIFKTHGLSKVPEYQAYKNMIARCYNKKNCNYKNYGARNITVCKEWLNSYDAFINDMGPKPSNKHSLDRIDNNKNYCKENCRWASKTTQSINQRKPKNNSTGVKGVTICPKSKKFVAQIGYQRKMHRIGCYKTLKEAALARKQAEEKYHKKHLL